MSGDTITRSGQPRAIAATSYLLAATSLGKCVRVEDGVIARRWPHLSDGEEVLWSVLRLVNEVDFEHLDRWAFRYVQVAVAARFALTRAVTS